MAKLRVHELAKELDKQSKDIINLLHDKGVDVKNHMTTLEDHDVDFVKKAFGSTRKGSMAENSKISDAEHKEEHKTEEVQKKKKNIIFVSNPQNSKLPGGASNLPPHSTNTKPAVKQSAPVQPAKPVTSGQPAPVKTEGRTDAADKGSQTQVHTANTEVKTEVKAAPVVQKESAPVQNNAQAAPVKETVQGTTQPVGSAPARPQTQNDNTARTYNNSGNQNRPYNNAGGQSRPYNNDGQNRPYNNTGGQSRPYNNDGQNRPYNNAGGQSRPYNNAGGQSRPYNNAGGQSRPYNNAGGQNRPYNNAGGQSRPYNNDGQNRPYNNAGGQNRPYNNAGGQNRPYNNAGGQNRPYNNDRFQKGDGRDDNRFGKPQGAKPFGGDSPIIQPEKRRDEAKRKLGQEKDSRSKRDKIYEDDAMKAKPGRFIRPEKKPKEAEEQIKVIVLPEILTIKELADKMKIQPSAIVKKLFLQGQVVTVNQEISYDAAEEIALEYEIMCEKEVVVDVIEELLREEEENVEEMSARPPVICVMGHVDHGKTSLLDAIRKTNVTDKEAGGITQHIGAYTVNIKDQKITFLDTPGHEAFTSMRMRGANATDIAILVVAADDGVMPQTVEAISHAKAAGIEIIVAVNKTDKPNANIERVKQELTEYELIPEDWGGSTVYAPVSAKTGEGIEQLLEMILLTSEILELKANPKRTARGLVIEAQLDKGRGPVATILVQKGTLHVGDFIAAGSCHGKVRAMIDDKGRRVKEAGPSTPVEILGLNDVPNAGDVFVAPENDKEAKQFADTFIAQNREKMLDDTKAKMSLDDLFTQIQAGNLKELNIIIKADVQGSVEAVKQSLVKLSNEEVVVKVIHGGVGAINESDVILASASKAIIIGFNVRHDATAKATAEREGVDLRLYKVIYQAIEDVEAAMKGMLDPVFEEKIIGHAEIRQIFKASAIGNIAGSYVLDGVLQRNCKVRISREGKQVFEGELEALKRFKDDVKEVKAGFECGLTFTGFDQFQELDVVEAYIMVEVPR
ncbi:MAG: translation initiation factor IF-2 [Lachnospiraceae bacterium]|nr:translation initiation factor IF-2 [Lachnospiraceae bacterium]